MHLPDLNIPLVAVQFGILLLALTVHESAHAWTSSRFGDPTARDLGRVSLNPIPHIDPIGTILFPLLGMISGLPVLGWARPVPVNPMNLRRPKSMGLWISAAGPLSNLALGLLFLVVLSAGYRAGLLTADGSAFGPESSLAGNIGQVLWIGVSMNIILAAFNLLPVPPLDGGGVLAGMLPDSMSEALDGLHRYGFLILYLMILVPVGGRSLLGWFFVPVSAALRFVSAIALGV